jgi:hypothetical protein
VQLLNDGKAFLECVLAFVMALGFQLKHNWLQVLRIGITS